jgi:hypothetical protein
MRLMFCEETGSTDGNPIRGGLARSAVLFCQPRNSAKSEQRACTVAYAEHSEVDSIVD